MRGSSFIWGFWEDAKYLAEHIALSRASYTLIYFDRAISHPTIQNFQRLVGKGLIIDVGINF